jgi:hypothetical protein
MFPSVSSLGDNTQFNAWINIYAIYIFEKDIIKRLHGSK